MIIVFEEEGVCLKEMIKDFLEKYQNRKKYRKDIGKIINRNLNHRLSRSNQNSTKVFNYLNSLFSQKSNPKIGLSEVYLKMLSNAIISRQENHLKIELELYQTLITCTSALTPSLLSSDKWAALSYISTANGLYRLGHLYRELSLSNVLNSTIQPRRIINVVEKYMAAIDVGKLEEAKRFIELASTLRYRNDLIDQMKLYYCLNTGDRQQVVEISRRYYSQSDILFSDLIRGKRIAVVGPAPSDDQVADEIDQYDLIIRLNYSGQEKMPPSDEFGSRIDISYYRPSMFKQLVKDQKHDCLNDLKSAVLISYSKAVDYHALNLNSQVRTFDPPYNFMFAGYPNMIQSVLYDLLCFEPLEIKLFKVNFSLSTKQYYSGYSHRTNDRKRISSTHAKHDLISQINFVRSLVKYGSVKADPACMNVLKLSNEEYISQMEVIYS